MKIAQVCPRYCPYIGGVETHVKEISERLVKKGYEVEVLTTDPKGDLPKQEVINGVIVKRFKCWAPGEAYYFSRAMRKYLAKNSENYDIVHAHSYHALPALYAAQAKSRNKLVFTPHYHGTGHTLFRKLLHTIYWRIAKAIFNEADRIICVSNYEKRLILEKFNVNEEKVTVIPNGINPEEFSQLRKTKKGYKTILYVGRLEKYKGIDYLIKVLQKLDDRFFLEIVGRGPYEKSLLKLASKLKVKDRIRFYHNLPRDQLLQKYSDASVFVMLSKHEAFCISVAEALAAKTPCIVANTSALKEWIDEKNCFGIEYPINIDKFASLINRISDLVVECPKLPTWDEVSSKTAEIYERLLSNDSV